MKPVVFNSLMGVGVAGFSSAIIYGIYYHFSPKTVKQKLLQAKFTLLDLSSGEGNEDKEEWNLKVTEHNKSDSTYPKFAIESADAEKLKKECEKVLKVSLLEEGSDNKVKQAEAWCFKGTIKGK